MALIDLVLLRLAFSVLVCVCLSVSMYRTEKRRYACLVPDDGGTKDASVERLEFCRLVFCTLVIGLGHVEVSLRVGDPFCLYRQRAGCRLCLSVQLTRLVSELGDRAPRRLFSLSRQRHRIPRCSASNQLRLLFKEPK